MEKRSAPDSAIDLADLVPAKIRRDQLAIPNLSEHDVVRHFTRLSQMNFGIDTGFYPLGSCTMKFNPKFTEELAALPTVTRIHPDQDESTVQGALRVLYELQDLLARIAGMDAVTLQPAAGAQGEYTGLLLAQAYHRERGEERHEVIIPDTAHGTNPASAGMLGFDLIEIPSKDGRVDLKALEAAAGPKTLALMLTNPNTLGIFEEHVLDIAQIVHDAGGLLYYDGANFNAILGRTSPGNMNFDIVHFNLHKTFTTPHGGGGPGAGPVGVKKPLEPFLPVPVIGLNGRGYHLNYDRPKSIGKVRAWYGNFALLVRAYAYILRMGGDGLKEVSERAVLNANYIRHRLAGVVDVPFGGLRKHEFVASAAKLAAEKGVRTVDLAKRLMDFGYHPPTVYFPHLVEEALMVEPPETATKETLDGFVDALAKIVQEHRPISVREAAEVPEASERPGLCRRHRSAGEPRGPLPDGWAVVAMAVDHRNRAFGVGLHLIRHDPIQVGDQDCRDEAPAERDRRRLVRGQEYPAGLPDLLLEVWTVSGHRDFLPPEDRPEGGAGNAIASEELVEFGGDRLVFVPGKAEIAQDLFVERLPRLEVHPTPPCA